MLEGGDQLEPGLGTEITQRPLEECAHAAVPVAVDVRSAVADHAVDRRMIALLGNGEAGRQIGDLPRLVHRPPGIRHDRLERRQRMTGAGPAEPGLGPGLELGQRQPATAHEPGEVAPQQIDHPVTGQVPLPLAMSRSSATIASRRKWSSPRNERTTPTATIRQRSARRPCGSGSGCEPYRARVNGSVRPRNHATPTMEIGWRTGPPFPFRPSAPESSCRTASTPADAVSSTT